MITNITSVAGWVTPQSVQTGDTVSSTLWNNLANDVAMLYGKPWITVALSANTTTSPFTVATDSQSAGTPIFKASNGGSYLVSQNSPSSGLGAFAVNSTTGQINFPTSSGTPIPGLYRITAQVMTQQFTTNFGRAILVVQGSSVLSYHPGAWAQSTSSSGVFPTFTVTAIIPVGFGTWASATNFYITGQNNGGTAPNALATDSGGHGPASSPPSFNTYVTAEFLGTSTGTF